MNRIRTLARSKLVFVILLGVCILIILWLSSKLTFTQLDLENYLHGGRMILRGQNPYGDVEFFAPPWFAIVFSPLLFLPGNFVATIWMFGNLTAVFGIAFISIKWQGFSNSRSNTFRYIGAVISPVALFCYITGQISPLITLSTLILTDQIINGRRKYWLYGLAALVATLKPHIVFFPLALCILTLIRKHATKPILWILGSIMAAMIISTSIVNDWLPSLLTSWMQGDFRGGKPGLISPGYLGLVELGIPIWIFGILGAFVLWLWWREGLSMKVITLALTVNLLLLPYSRSYDFVVLILPVIYLTEIRRRSDYWILGLSLFVFYILPFTDLSILTPVILVIALLARISTTPKYHAEISAL